MRHYTNWMGSCGTQFSVLSTVINAGVGRVQTVYPKCMKGIFGLTVPGTPTWGTAHWGAQARTASLKGFLFPFAAPKRTLKWQTSTVRRIFVHLLFRFSMALLRTVVYMANVFKKGRSPVLHWLMFNQSTYLWVTWGSLCAARIPT